MQTTPNHKLQYPQAGDPVAVHTDFEALAKTTEAALDRLATRKYMSGSFDANTAEDGRSLVFTGVSQINTPEQSTWLIQTETIGDTARMQIATEFGFKSRVYTRFSGSQGWSEWKQIDASANDTPVSTQNGARVLPMSLTVGAGTLSYPNNGRTHYRVPFTFPNGVRRFRIHYKNVNIRSGATGTAGVLTSQYIALMPTSTTAALTGVQAISGSDTMVNGEYVTPWIENTLDANKMYCLAFGVTNTVGTVYMNLGGCYESTDAPVATSAGTWARRNFAPFHIWMEVEIGSNVPAIAAFGDSLSSGVGADLPTYNSWLSQYARRVGALPVHYTASGDTMEGWQDPTHYKWSVWKDLDKPDAVVHAMGSNDVFGGATLQQMKDRRAATIRLLEQHVSKNVYSATIMPREQITGTPESIRRQYNTWLNTYPDSARDVFDFVGAVSLDDETLIDSIDSDGVHLNTAGYAAVSAAITRPVIDSSKPTPIDTLTQLTQSLLGRTSMLPDSSFEESTGLVGSEVPGQVEISNEWSFSGLRSIRFTTDGDGGNVFSGYVTLPLRPGNTYLVHAKSYNASSTPLSMIFGVQGKTSPDSAYSSVTVATSDAISNGQIGSFTHAFTVPKEYETEVRYYVGIARETNTVAGRHLYMDDLKIVNITDVADTYMKLEKAAR